MAVRVLRLPAGSFMASTSGRKESWSVANSASPPPASIDWACSGGGDRLPDIAAAIPTGPDRCPPSLPAYGAISSRLVFVPGEMLAGLRARLDQASEGLRRPIDIRHGEPTALLLRMVCSAVPRINDEVTISPRPEALGSDRGGRARTEVYSVATSCDQARIVLEEAERMWPPPFQEVGDQGTTPGLAGRPSWYGSEGGLTAFNLVFTATHGRTPCACAS